MAAGLVTDRVDVGLYVGSVCDYSAAEKAYARQLWYMSLTFTFTLYLL